VRVYNVVSPRTMSVSISPCSSGERPSSAGPMMSFTFATCRGPGADLTHRDSLFPILNTLAYTSYGFHRKIGHQNRHSYG
jgi:hypothetical protein